MPDKQNHDDHVMDSEGCYISEGGWSGASNRWAKEVQQSGNWTHHNTNPTGSKLLRLWERQLDAAMQRYMDTVIGSDDALHALNEVQNVRRNFLNLQQKVDVK